MTRRQRIIELEQKICLLEAERTILLDLLFSKGDREPYYITLVKQIANNLTPQALTTDAEMLAKYLSSFPTRKICGGDSCIRVYSIPVEEIDKFIPKQETEVGYKIDN